jgi:hypothetical protein
MRVEREAARRSHAPVVISTLISLLVVGRGRRGRLSSLALAVIGG